MKKLNETIFCRWVEEVWNEGKESVIDELYADEAVADYPNHFEQKSIYGKEEYKKFFRLIRALFSDIRITIEQIASDGEKVIAFCIFNANRRQVETKDVSVKSPITVSGLCQMVIENGTIIRAWCDMDLFEINHPKNKNLFKESYLKAAK